MEIFEEFDNKYDSAQIAKDVEEKGGSSDYEKLPSGDYEVTVEKAELKKTAKGNPMVSFWLKVVSGDYKGKRIFYNQAISEDPNKAHTGIHFANEFMKSLQTGVEIKFVKFSQWNDVILDVAEYAQNKEYHLEYVNGGENGFDKFTITELLSDKGDGVPF